MVGGSCIFCAGRVDGAFRFSFTAVHSLQGALGKTSGRSYKAAPRQLLQVDVGAGPSPTLSHATATQHISKPKEQHHEDGADEAAKLGQEALGTAADVRHFFICSLCVRCV